MNERSDLISWIRGELVGPSQTLVDPVIIEFQDTQFVDPERNRRGPLAWQPVPDGAKQEVLYFDRETPHRKYGAGLLHPAPLPQVAPESADSTAAEATDVLATDTDDEDVAEGDVSEASGETEPDAADVSDDFEVTSADSRRPSTLGISLCVRLADNGQVIVRLPQRRHLKWQKADSAPVALNGRYELCNRRWSDAQEMPKDSPVWRRRDAVAADTMIAIDRSELRAGKVVSRTVQMPADSPVALLLEVFPRKMQGLEDHWLLTVVLRNLSPFTGTREPRESILYQTYFEVAVQQGELVQYPESRRPFAKLDAEEQSLALLYRESATWAIGHGCAAGWDTGPGEAPEMIYADVMPAVQIPSMTPEISDSAGNPIQLSMRALASLPDDGQGGAWQSLSDLATEYAKWIQRARDQISDLPADLRVAADRHMDACNSCLIRINTGIRLLRENDRIRKAFRLANLSMLLQQIATKHLKRRPLSWDNTLTLVRPEGTSVSPWNVYENNEQGSDIGSWRAFQIAFLLMSLEGVADERSDDREIVDLIWFPTGGGKTEAYLGVMAFYMFHERLLSEDGSGGPRRDGTNVLMRYTLRMLTTQQFQRAASLVCAMEFLRRTPDAHKVGKIAGQRFSLGLWIGADGSPNNIGEARAQLNAFRKGDTDGNPLVLTECPWCRAQIGRYDGAKPKSVPNAKWNAERTKGVSNHPDQGPLLHCSDGGCEFGSEHWQNWLPIEVIDGRIYDHPPSIVIATADKLAIIAYRPKAGALFGRTFSAGQPKQAYVPPGLIVQDELHLISGPLGTMYALYEGIFERLCSRKGDGDWFKPKLIASTATIRGADDQVRALYSRTRTQLFPSPGLLMGDSFFGKYARHENGTLRDGRLYLGIHASDYGSILTAQVRAFSSALFRPFSFAPDRRDPWWSLVVFYNSIRELGGAKTLFDADIRSRLKFLFNRENFPPRERRNLRIIDELTSRLSQAEIVGMMDLLSTVYSEADNKAPDACLASSIIEVGVDIDRLSLMGVVGQPKTTAQYIQVTGRVGRRWWERPGLIMMIYNPNKSRDRSHFEQFHSYHRRLYERVEPTSATPFALSAIQRALPGALILWARQHSDAGVQNETEYAAAIESGFELLCERCENVQPDDDDRQRSIAELNRVRAELEHKWNQNPQAWEEFPPKIDGEYLMLWPGQFATRHQKDRGVVIPSSMRQVDGSGELTITQGYASGN